MTGTIGVLRASPGAQLPIGSSIVGSHLDRIGARTGCRCRTGFAHTVKDCGAKAPPLPEQGDVDLMFGIEIDEVARER